MSATPPIQANVTSISSATQARQAETHKKLLTMISLCPWALEIDHILHAAGHQLSPAVFEAPALPLAVFSDANRFGHTSLEQFITRPHAELGLAMKWDDWARKAGASYFKMKYGVFHDDPAKVMSEYQDVIRALKREPANAMEYAQVRTEIMTQLHRQREFELKASLDSMRQRSETLSRDLNVSMDARNALERECSDLTARLEALPRQHLEELEMLSSRLNNDHEIALITQRNSLELAGELKITQATEEQRIRIRELNSQIDGLRIVAQDENRVPRSTHVALQHELSREKDTRIHFETANQELTRQLTQARSDLRLRDDDIVSKNDEIKRVSNMLEQLERRLFTGEAASAPAIESEEGLNAMQAQLDQMAVDMQALHGRCQHLLKRDQKWSELFEKTNGNYAKATRDLVELKQRYDHVRDALATCRQRLAEETAQKEAHASALLNTKNSRGRWRVVAVVAVMAAGAFTYAHLFLG